MLLVETWPHQHEMEAEREPLSQHGFSKQSLSVDADGWQQTAPTEQLMLSPLLPLHVLFQASSFCLSCGSFDVLCQLQTR